MHHCFFRLTAKNRPERAGADFRRIYGVQTGHCCPAGQLFTSLLKSLEDSERRVRALAKPGSTVTFGRISVVAQIALVASVMVSVIPVIRFVTPLMRGRAISARLLRSPARPDCAFIPGGMLRVQSLHLPIMGSARRYLRVHSIRLISALSI